MSGGVAGAAIGAISSLGGSGGGGTESSQQSQQTSQNDQYNYQKPSTFAPTSQGYLDSIPIYQAAGSQAMQAFSKADADTQVATQPIIQGSYAAFDNLLDSLGVARPEKGSYYAAQQAQAKIDYAAANDPATLYKTLRDTYMQTFNDSRVSDLGRVDIIRGLNRFDQIKDPNARVDAMAKDLAADPWYSDYDTSNIGGNKDPNKNFSQHYQDPWSAGSLNGATAYTPVTTTTVEPNSAGMYSGRNLGVPGQDGYSWGTVGVPGGLVHTTTSEQLNSPPSNPYADPYAPAQFSAPTKDQLALLTRQNVEHSAQWYKQNLANQDAADKVFAARAMAKPSDEVLALTDPTKASQRIMDLITSDPNYQFQLQQGNKSIQAMAAAKGMGNNPRLAAELQTFGQGQASSALQNYQDRMMAITNAGMSQIGLAAQSRANAASGVAQTALNTAGNVAGATTGATNTWNVGPITSETISHQQQQQSSSQTQSGGGNSMMQNIGNAAGALGGFLNAPAIKSII